jgi:hypothetical protein
VKFGPAAGIEAPPPPDFLGPRFAQLSTVETQGHPVGLCEFTGGLSDTKDPKSRSLS